MPVLIVVNNVKEWPFDIRGVEVIDAKQYLMDAQQAERRGVKLFNLCRTYRYQSIGYYVTLLAAARGHKPLPSIKTIQDMRSQTMVRFVSDDLDEIIQEDLAPVHAAEFTLSIYFGRNLAKRYDRLSLNLFNLFQSPLLRAQFVRGAKWTLRQIGPIPVDDIPKEHRDFVLQQATNYFAGRRASVRKRVAPKYDLAILVNPAEELPPSDEKALKRFAKAGESLGFSIEFVTRDDYARLAEFDALFIRETTRVGHHTYRFSSRAAAEGLVVIDDPESILRCTNKVYLAELLNRYGVPTPRTMLVHAGNMEAVGAELGFPCVLKQPDGSFSQGVVKVEDEESLIEQAGKFLEDSDLVIAQEFLPTDFDWRIGIIDRQPIYACKYYMVKSHWQIYKRDRDGKAHEGRSETVPAELAPRDIVRAALRAANLIGDGFYGVDVKQSGKQGHVIEINDNPSVDAGVEDAVLKDDLYRRIMSVFLRRIERNKALWDRP